MDFIKKWLFEKGAQNIMGKLFGTIDGYKTYILAAVGVLVGLVGHFWGPFNIGPVTIPAMTWNEVWNIVWNGGLFSLLRSGVKKVTPAA
jgi:hypothetical protein